MVSITSIIVLISLIAFGSSTCDFSTDLCSRSSVSCGTLTSRDTSSQNGNTLTVGSHTYSGSDFNLISFNSLTIANGDIQGRVAVKNNFYGLQGISVADLVSDSSVYSLVVGGSLEWGTSGELYPMNAGTMFVGQANPSLPSNLVSRVTGFCPNGQCLDAAFGTLYNYWASFSASIAGQTANAAHSLGNDGTLTLTCQAAGSAYFVNIDSSDFNRVVGYTIAASCSSSASWVINIVGSGEVYFGGNSIVATGDIIFNIAGSARRIIVAASINGHVVAPNCDLNMLGGTIYGDVIVSNATIIQVNTPSCPISSSTGSSATGSSATGSSATGSSATGSSATGSSATGSSATGSSATGSSSTESASGSASGASSTESATGSSATGASSTDSASGSATTGAETVLTTATVIGATGGSAIENGNSGVVGSASTSSSVIVIPSLLIMFVASLLF